MPVHRMYTARERTLRSTLPLILQGTARKGSKPKGYAMPKSLQRPVVLLTGASSGIGYDVAPLLVRYGYTVYGAARRVE